MKEKKLYLQENSSKEDAQGNNYNEFVRGVIEKTKEYCKVGGDLHLFLLRILQKLQEAI